MKVKSKITIQTTSGEVKLTFHDNERVLSASDFSICNRDTKSICVGDYVESDGVLCRVSEIHTEEVKD